MSYTAGQRLRAYQLGPVPCTSATRPSSPTEGLEIVESDTGMVAIYSGGAWRYLYPTGEVSTHGEYNVSGAQSIPNSTPLVTKATSGVGHQFTLNRSGLWAITLSTGTASATGERTAAIRDSVGPMATGGVIGAGVAHCFVSLCRYLASGTVVTCSMFQSTGGAINTLTATGENRLHIAWVHS